MTMQKAGEQSGQPRRTTFFLRLVLLILLGVIVVWIGLLWSGLIVTPGPAPPIIQY